MRPSSIALDFSWTPGKGFVPNPPSQSLTHNLPSLQSSRRKDWLVSTYETRSPPSLVCSRGFSIDWQLWTAATVTDANLQTKLISLVKKYASSRLNNRPFPDRYNSANGQMGTANDRTVVGGHFALVRRSTLSHT